MPAPSPIYNRSKNLKVYDDGNQSEHALLSSFSDEFIQIQSPRIYYFRVDFKSTEQQTDDVSKLYGETENIIMFKPIEVFALVERSPVIEELTKIGLSNLSEVTLTVNIDDITSKLGDKPKGGDMLCIYNVNTQGKAFKNFYKVASATPSEMVNSRYINYNIFAEQTSLDDVEDDIRSYLVKELA